MAWRTHNEVVNQMTRMMEKGSYGKHHRTMSNLCLFLAAFVLASQRAIAQDHAPARQILICVIEVQGGATWEQQSGKDAKDLASLLSGRILANKETIRAVPIFAWKRPDIEAQVEREGCDYTVEIDRYDSFDANNNLPANIPSSMAADAGPAAPSIGDRALVGYDMRAKGSRKSIRGGVAIPPMYHGRSHTLITPFPAWVTDIVKKLNRIEPK